MSRFGVLGPMAVHSGDGEIPIPGHRLRTLLALLLAEPNRVLGAAQLAAALWEGRPPQNADRTILTYLSRLRRTLDAAHAGATIVTHSAGYALHVDPGTIDAARFAQLAEDGRVALDAGEYRTASSRLREALALWRGDAYSEFLDILPLRVEADRLEELRGTARENRIAADLALGAGAELIPELEKLLSDTPQRERLWGQLVTALYRAGRQADALAAYRRARNFLVDTLGVEPSPQLQDIHAQILAHDPRLLGPCATRPPALPPPPKRVPGRRRSRRVLALAAVTATAACATAVIVATRGGDHARRLTAPTLLPANTVGVLDSDGTLRGWVPVGTEPSGLAYGHHALWVANRADDTVYEIDPDSRQVVQRIQVGSAPEALAVTDRDVWVANTGSGTVSRINIAAGQLVDTIRVGIRPSAIAAGPGAVWVANGGDNTVQRIDEVTGRAGAAIGVGDGPDGIAVDLHTVWVANARDGTVSRVDTAGRAPGAAPVRVGAGPKGITLSGDVVWVADQLSRTVTRLDRNGEGRIDIAVGDGPESVVVAGGAAWTSNRYDGTVSRIDPRTGRVHSIRLGSSPRGLAVTGGRVWVAASALNDRRHRGGTLTVATNLLPGHDESVDPAWAYLVPTIGPQAIVYDGLVAIRQTMDANVLVPDLAEAIPVPTDGRRTYSFTVRRGIRYSNGEVVRSADFELGLRRALVVGYGRPDFFYGIVGARACGPTKPHCDLSAGIATDDARRRVTIHLTAPDPDFLYKLAWFVYPMPPGTPLTPARAPLPGTGPYRIAQYVPDKVYRLERNHYFRQWSFAAQPDGYPDVIRWVRTDDTRTAAELVATGHADLAPLTTLSDRSRSGALVAELRRRYPTQLHRTRFPGATFVMFDTRVAPFDNADARRAVNWAVDRRVLVDLYGGPAIASPTCQLLPPGFPSYSWYCPYTRGPDDGSYHGPDLARARELVRRSGTVGTRVAVWKSPSVLVPPFSEYMVRVLRQLGYDAVLRKAPDAAYVFDPRHHLQVQSYGWGADYPLASTFYDGIASCLNTWAFCDPALDREAARAANLQFSDPGAALRAWTTIDRTVTDRAAVVPGVSTWDWRFVSARVGNYTVNEFYGPVLSQLWVR